MHDKQCQGAILYIIFSSNKIILYRFHVERHEDELGIGYDMIIFRDLMVHLGLVTNFKVKVLQWDGAVVTMKYPIGLLGQQYLTCDEMNKVVM